jgi:predicted HNH restriction endonuclease
MYEIQDIILKNKLDRAKKDLDFWKSMNNEIGQPKQDDTDFKLFFSCRIMDKGNKKCKTYDVGECVFYNCHTRKSSLDWKEHHKKYHSKDNMLYVCKSCNECKNLHDEETRFMEGRISDLERELEAREERRNSHAAVSKEISASEDTNLRKNPISPEYQELIETVDADLDSIKTKEFFEGKKVQGFTTRYERNLKLRSKAIWFHGFKCMVCGFNFEQKYGERGSKFIEVHHLKPVSSLEEVTNVDPKTEMAVVCSNCHSMIHRKKNMILSLEELRKIIQVK